MTLILYLISLSPVILIFFLGERGVYPVILYFIMSLVCFLLYYVDKRRAVKEIFRIPEQKLHLTELMFGWPGGIIAQQVLRHKRIKKTYQVKFWIIVSLHFVLWVDIIVNERIRSFLKLIDLS